MDIKELQNKVIEFREERGWGQYHNPKDLAISISLEAAELLEIFQWKDAGQVEALKSDVETRRKVKEEVGDILIYALTLAHEGIGYGDRLNIYKTQPCHEGIFGCTKRPIEEPRCDQREIRSLRIFNDRIRFVEKPPRIRAETQYVNELKL